MLPSNKRYFDILGITNFHKAGITGEGMKIAVMDSVCDVSHPIYNGQVELIYDGEVQKNSFSHGGSVCHVLTQVCPNAKIYLMKCKAESMQWCIDNDIDVINISLGTGSSDPDFHRLAKIAKAKGILLFTSAGNRAERGLTKLALNPDWIAVGALRLYNPGKSNEYITRASYSSISKANAEVWSSVEVTVFSGINIQSPKNTIGFAFNGTSCASPLMAGMTTLLKQIIDLNQDSIRELLPKQAHDLGVPGFDVEYGYGMFVLPEFDEEWFNKEYIIVHHTGAEEKDAEQIKRTHMNNGFRDIGYNYVIERDGKIVKGRPLDIVGAHTKGIMNTIGIGIALIGNFDERQPTHEQYASLKKLILELTDDYFISLKTNLLGHKEVEGQATRCPGQYLDMNKLRNEVIGVSTKTDYDNHWAKTSIELVIKNKIMSGYPDGSFKPNQFVTRAEMASILQRALNLK